VLRSYIYAFTFISSTLSFFLSSPHPTFLHSFPTRRSSDLRCPAVTGPLPIYGAEMDLIKHLVPHIGECLAEGLEIHGFRSGQVRSEEHTSELQSRFDLVCRLLLEKTKQHTAHQRKLGSGTI